jgi:transposase-like protein
MTVVDEQPRPAGGRPSKLTEERADAILQSVEQGSYLKVAALSAGVGESTLHRWLANGVEAQRNLDAHDPDRLYCPTCDLDRTDDAHRVDEHNRAEDAREPRSDDDRASAVGAAPARAYAVLDRCPRCRTDEYPRPFELTPEQERYREFREQLTRAEATAETTLVAAWAAAASGPDGDWRAARDLLARRAPERWAGVTRVQMTNEETERRLDDAVSEALLALGLVPGDDDDLPEETEEP